MLVILEKDSSTYGPRKFGCFFPEISHFSWKPSLPGGFLPYTRTLPGVSSLVSCTSHYLIPTAIGAFIFVSPLFKLESQNDVSRHPITVHHIPTNTPIRIG